MAIRPRDVYRGRRKSRSLFTIIVTVFFALLITVVLLFFTLRNYVVYDEYGNATIVLPFQRESRE